MKIPEPPPLWPYTLLVVLSGALLVWVLGVAISVLPLPYGGYLR